MSTTRSNSKTHFIAVDEQGQTFAATQHGQSVGAFAKMFDRLCAAACPELAHPALRETVDNADGSKTLHIGPRGFGKLATRTLTIHQFDGKL